MSWPTKAERAAKAGETAPPVATRKPNISVLERRVANPFGEPSARITLKDDSYGCRWFNADIAHDHIWRAKHKGWENVTPGELADVEQLGSFQKSPDGFVVRGVKGSEVLMKMPHEWRDKIQASKTEANKAMMRPGATKARVAAAAGQQFGDEAHDFISKAKLVGDVVDQTEVIHRRVPAEGEAAE